MPDVGGGAGEEGAGTRSVLPEGACDAHSHIYGPAVRFPYRPDRTYDPADAPYEAYLAQIAARGFERAVFVQPAVYGVDYRAMIDALGRGEGRSAGVGLVACDIADAELEALHRAGLRGARFNFMPHLGPAPGRVEIHSLARRLSAIGWHLCLHLDMKTLRQQADLIASLDCPVVIDHMARIRLGDRGVESDITFLENLLSEANVWIKLSGADRAVAAHAELGRMEPVLARLHTAAPDRSLWGFDWPHPNVDWPPDDGALVDLLLGALPDPGAIRQVLAENPERLYFRD